MRLSDFTALLAAMPQDLTIVLNLGMFEMLEPTATLGADARGEPAVVLVPAPGQVVCGGIPDPSTVTVEDLLDGISALHASPALPVLFDIGDGTLVPAEPRQIGSGPFETVTIDPELASVLGGMIDSLPGSMMSGELGDVRDLMEADLSDRIADAHARVPAPGSRRRPR